MMLIRQIADELVRDIGQPLRQLWEELVDQDGPRYASRIFAKVIEAIVELGRTCVVERLESRPPGLPVLIALKPPTQVREHPQMTMPLALQDIEVYAASVSDYDHLLGDAA